MPGIYKSDMIYHSRPKNNQGKSKINLKLPRGSAVKNLPPVHKPQETGVQYLGWGDPLQESMHPTPMFLPGEFHGQRSLVGYSPKGHKESNTTEAT